MRLKLGLKLLRRRVSALTHEIRFLVRYDARRLAERLRDRLTAAVVGRLPAYPRAHPAAPPRFSIPVGDRAQSTLFGHDVGAVFPPSAGRWRRRHRYCRARR